MKIALFGATGKTGREIIAAARAAGHTISAHARDGAKLADAGEGVTVFAGALDDSSLLDRMLEGCDAAISAMGTVDRKPNMVLSDATRRIVAAMEGRGLSRFVCVTSLGCGESKAQVRSLVMRLVIATVAKQIWADKDRQEAVVRGSALDYLLVRPGGLSDKPTTGNFRVLAAHEPAGRGQMITRADVAAFCLAEATRPSYHRDAVTLLPS